jgi:hypothetical protein
MLAMAAAGCGKKGPPLPPLVRLPAAPDLMAPRRLGSTVFLQVRIPSVNTDKTAPADLIRVDVYAVAGPAADAESVFRSGSRIASIPVRGPAGEDEQAARGERLPGGTRREAPRRPAGGMETGFDPGDVVVVTETIGGDEPRGPAPRKGLPKNKARAGEERAGADISGSAGGFGPLVAPALLPLPERVYVAVGINHRNRKGAASALQAVLLVSPASAPPAPVVTYTERAFSVSWTPPPDARPPEPPGEWLKGRPIGSRQVFGGYNVYEVPASPGEAAGPGAPGGAAPGVTMPLPVNGRPLGGPPLGDERMKLGVPRCYAVRAVTVYDSREVESERSEATCVTPVDTFPPAAPAGLKAVAGEGSISLIWDTNTEADLAGYVVLRADLPGERFEPLTPQPIRETGWTDTTVTPGRRYAYVVVAVDTSNNRSDRSNRVEETAR